MISNFFGRYPLIHKIVFIAYAICVCYAATTILNRVSRQVTDENIFSGNTPKIVVTSVAPGGASDRAGMLVGDTIISINGKNFLNAQDADRILRLSEPGQIMDYLIIRKGLISSADTLLLKVQAAKIGVRANTIILTITFIAFLIFGLYVGLVRANVESARLLGWSMVFLSPLFIVFGGGGTNTIPEVLIAMNAVFFGFLTNSYADILIPENDSKHKTAKRILDVTLLINFILYLLTFFSFFGKFIVIPIAKVSFLGNMPLTIVLAILVLIVSGILVAAKFRDRSSSAFLKPVSYSWAVMGLSFGVFLSLGQISNPIYFYGLLLTMAPPVMWFYLIANKRLFGINIAIRRSVQYSVFNSIFWVVLIVSYFWFLNFISNNIHLGDLGFRLTPTALEFGNIDAPGFTDRPFFILIGILSFVLLIFIKRRGQLFLNKLFFKEDYNYHLAILEISEIIATNIKMNDLTKSLTDELTKIMKLKGVALYTKEGDSYHLKAQTGFDPELLESINCDVCYSELNAIDRPIGIEKTTQEETFKKALVQFIAPMKIKDNCIGMLLLGEKESETAFKVRDIQFIESLSVQIAVAIENARLSDNARKNDLIKRDLELARKIQMNLLPAKIPSISGLQLAGSYIPANDVGGDYYDFLTPIYNVNTEPNKVTIVVGDVSGKGVSASLYMSRVQGIIRSLYHTGSFTPKQLLSHANQLIYSETDRKSFITMVCAEFNMKSNTMTYSRAGHLPILHYSAKSMETSQHSSIGLALGMKTDDTFKDVLGEQSVSFEHGDIFVLYSDGITEAMNMNSEEYGFGRIPELLKNNAQKSAGELLDLVKRDLSYFVGEAEPSDDITLVIVKIG